MFDFLINPFVEYDFMRKALVACLALSLSYAPIGLLLILRRMSLAGDALSHGILPGVAIGFMLTGFSIWAMSIGGFIAGLFVALSSGLVTRFTGQREDTSFAVFYLISLSIGVLIISLTGNDEELLHMLFGTITKISDNSLIMLASITSLSLIIIAVVFRPLFIECFDSKFLSAIGYYSWIYHFIFLILVVMNLVSGFQALGTLMALGLMILPAATSHFWAKELWKMIVIAGLIAIFSSYIGLLIAFHAQVPSGPAIILTTGGCYLLSLFIGKRGSLLQHFIHNLHLKA
jgi:zinc/manganese transport system permease protein